MGWTVVTVRTVPGDYVEEEAPLPAPRARSRVPDTAGLGAIMAGRLRLMKCGELT